MSTPTKLAEDIRALELFNEKAEELQNSSLVRKLQSEDSGWNLTVQESGTSASRFGPDDESYKAFVLTFRFFVQDRDGISIRKMAARYRSLYNDSLIPKELLDNVDDARDKLLRYLDSNTIFIVGGQGEKARAITHREVLDLFLYGNLAHVDTHKKERFDEWKKGPMEIVFPGFENYFVLILSTYLRIILYIRGQNEKVLVELRSKDIER